MKRDKTKLSSNNIVKHKKVVSNVIDEEIGCLLRGGKSVIEVAGFLGVSVKYVNMVKEEMNLH